jgi:hypothetical protein
LPRPWGKPGERRDPLAVELPKLRQLGNQGSRDHRPDAWHRDEQVFLLAPGRRAAHGIVNALIKRGELLFERLDETRDALLQMFVGELPLGDDHLDDLAASCDKTSEKLRRFVRERADFRLHRRGEKGDHAGIDWIGLAAVAQSLCEGADLGRVYNDNGQPSEAAYNGCFARRREARRDHRLEATGGFDGDRHRRQSGQACNQRIETCRIQSGQRNSRVK